jgi:transcriptional antiterminator RfaH
MNSWFLAQLKPNSAKIAERNLQRQDFQTFLPMEEKTKRVLGKFKTALQPLFPGYIFVAFNTSSSGWRAVNSTVGVTRLVSFGKDPAPVPPEIISQLLLRCDPEGKLMPAKLLNPGDKVRLASGPFADFTATVEKIAPNQRIWVLMEIMGGQRRIAVPAGGLKPA